jgi:tetratricopeptide (TPR) repeat protein
MTKSVLIICIFFAYLRTSAQPEAVLLKTADSLNKLEKYDAAITAYSKILSQKPQHEKALLGRGLAYVSNNKSALAEKDFKEAIRLNASCSDCHTGLGQLKLFQNDIAAAAVAADKAMELDSKNAGAWILKGRILLTQKKYSDASSSFTKAISFDSSNAGAYYFRSFVSRETKMFRDALSDLYMVTKLAPADADAYYETGAIYSDQKNWVDAMKYFLLAIQKDSSNSEYFKALANTYFATNDIANAVKYYTKAIKLNDKDVEAYIYRGEANYSIEDMDASCNDYKAALSKIAPGKDIQTRLYITGRISEFCDSSKAEYYYQRGIASYNLNQFNKAVEWYNKGLQKFPNHFMLTSFRGGALLKMNEYDKAESDYTKAMALKDQVAQETNSSYKFQEATAAQRQAYINHTIAENYMHRAEARLTLNNYAGAMADIDEALRIMPPGEDGVADFYYVKGSVYLAQQDNNSALNWFNKAIQVVPGFAPALVNRALVKLNLAYRTTVVQRHVGIKDASIALPSQTRVSVNTDNLEAALSDCNKAIAAESKYAYAYYIRAMVKIALKQPDQCYDLLKAEQLGYTEARLLIEENKCR